MPLDAPIIKIVLPASLWATAEDMLQCCYVRLSQELFRVRLIGLKAQSGVPHWVARMLEGALLGWNLVSITDLWKSVCRMESSR